MAPALVFQPQQDWYAYQLPKISSRSSQGVSEKVIQELFSLARDLLLKENEAHASVSKSTSSYRFYLTMMSSGTLSDKISALTLSIQESPVHNKKALESLVALARKHSRSQAVQVLGALKDLFSAGALLPSDRRLRNFAQQPDLANLASKDFKHWNRNKPMPSPLNPLHLILWAFEDWLKAIYFEIIKLLEVWCSDEITFSRLKAVDYVYELLREKPEQEANLLRLLVNKLGDPEKKVASKASSNLVQLQVPHPLMKSVIISTIESQTLFKRGEGLHAKYYAVITLNQTILSVGQQEIVQSVLNAYFALFLGLLGKKEHYQSYGTKKNGPIGQLQRRDKHSGVQFQKKKRAAFTSKEDCDLKEKIISAILTGINRAFPYASSNDEFFERHLDTLFRVTHSSNFNTSIQALMLIQQLCGSHQAASDRFYRTLYESLLDPRLLSTSKQTLYINLLYRALKADIDYRRVQAFVKRLTQVSAMHQPPFACAAIFLTKELEKTHPSLHTLIDQPEAADGSVDNDDLEDSLERPQYDGRKRDPQFSRSENSCLWEMHPLTSHFHPSVSLFVSKLLAAREVISTRPDLSMHSLISFLDRFVYRNPKKITNTVRGASLMQPMAATQGADLLLSALSKQVRSAQPVNMVGLSNLSKDHVKPDDAFFHKYFGIKSNGLKQAHKRKAKKRKFTDDGESESGMESEDEIWKALVHSRPELEGDEDDDIDMGSSITDSESNADELSGEENIVKSVGAFELEDSEAYLDSDEVVSVPGDEHTKNDLHLANGVQTAEPGQAKKRRKLLKDLPTFAFADDYAALLNDGD